MNQERKTIAINGTVRLEGGAYTMGVQLARHYCGPAIEGVLSALPPDKRPLALAGLITEICIQAETFVGTPFMLAMLESLLKEGSAVESAGEATRSH